MTYKLVVGVNSILAFAHIFWTLLGTVSVLPAFYDIEFVMKLDQPGLNEVRMYRKGVLSARAPGLGWLGFLVSYCLRDSAWANGNLAEVAMQLGKMVEHPNKSQPNPGLRAHGTPCTC